MKYDKEKQITTVNDVKDFFHHIVYERKVNFHPDEDFESYINYDNKIPTFTPDEVKAYNRLIDQSFDVCEKNKADVYQLACDELFKVYGM